MLDFNINRDSDRKNKIEEDLKNLPKKPANSELEKMANYILFGKDKDGLSLVDKGEIEIETRYKSYKKRDVGSLDELMELPGFDQQHFKPIKRSTYTNPKPTLNLNNPNLTELRKEISRIQEIYDKATEGIPVNNKTYTSTEIYNLKHLLISLKKEQYIIDEASTQKFEKKTDQAIYFEIPETEIDVYPMGLKMGDLERFSSPRTCARTDKVLFNGTDLFIDLEDPEHIYQLIEHYDELKKVSQDNPFKSTKYLIDTLDYYIEKANLEPSRTLILNSKINKLSNNDISKLVEEKFNLGYNPNYISTIYKKDICKKIANSASTHYLYWKNRSIPKNWKQCCECGEWKLKTSEFFTKKNSSIDRLNNQCKCCEKKKRKNTKKEVRK